MADNWYVILELDFDPPVEDEGVIAARIDEKGKFWSRNFTDFNLGPQYRTWHQNIPRIKKDMLGERNRRKELAAEACALVYGPVDKLLRTIGRKGSVTAAEEAKLAQRLKVPVDVVKRRAKALGIQESAGDTRDWKAIYDKYYKAKPQNAAAFDGMKAMLATFQAENLYDFLYPGDGGSAASLPCGTLRDRAAQRKKTEFYKHDSVSGTGSKLCGQCEVAFRDDAAKDVYDKYLEYSRRRAILEEARSIADISGELSAGQAQNFVAQLTLLFKDRGLSQDVLTAFCKTERIAMASAGGEDKSGAQVKVCRCGHINNVSDGRKVCAACGLELAIRCPKCGTENDANIKVCRCGFRLENIDRAVALCGQAEKALDALDFPVADAHLKDADSYWPGSARVKALRERLKDYERRVGLEVGELHKAMASKRFLDARGRYQRIQKLFAGYKDEAIESRIGDAIAKAEKLFAQAKAAKGDKAVLDLCTRAYELCADLPGVRELMPAPPPVASLAVAPDALGRVNRLSWPAGGDSSIRYVLVRNAQGWPRNPGDGEVIYQGSGSGYGDGDIQPAVPYYYNIFAQRAGLSSAGCGNLPAEAVNLFEVSGVSLVPGDGSLSLGWMPLPKGAVAEVYQQSGTGESHLGSTAADGYLITGLANDRSYTFRVALGYQAAGEKKLTKGVAVTGTPTCPPLPVDSLRVKANQGDLFDAVWYHSGPGEVRLFGSLRKPERHMGDVIPLAALEKEMRPLRRMPLSPEARAGLAIGEDGAGFAHSGPDVLYVTAAAVRAGSAVFGSLARAGRGETVKIKDVREVNGQVGVYIEPPKDASGFVVLYSFERFPQGISDTQTVRKYIPLKAYQLAGGLMLDGVEARPCYLAVFAEFKRDGEKDYSAGETFLFDNSPKENITYSVTVDKKLFGESSVTLEFEAENREFTLPDIDVMSGVGNTPMFKASAQHFHSIPGQRVRGTLKVKIPLPKGMPKDTYIKAFFADGKIQAQLRLKLKSSYKIT